MEEKKQFPPSLAILLFILVAVLGLFVYLNRSRLGISQEAGQNPVISTPIPTQIPTFITLQAIKTEKIASLAQPLVLQATADSHGQEVVGFDILLDFDQSAFTFVKAESPDPTFSVFANLTPTHISITGIKKTSVKAISPLAKSPILNLTFQPKKAGSFTFTLSPKKGRETTKLVNTNSKIFNPVVQSVTVQLK